MTDTQSLLNAELIELSVVVDTEAAEAVSELFNRYNGGGYDDDNEAGEAGGGGAVIEGTGFDLNEYATDDPLTKAATLVVKTFIKPGLRGNEIRRQIEEGLWRLSLLYPIPEPQIRVIRTEDWANAWKQFYKPLRVGNRVVLKPSWEEFSAQADDIVIELDPGMAFGTGLHPSTRLCVVALEERVRPGDAVLDIGTGSGVLAIVAKRLGAGALLATDIDALAVRVAGENIQRNGMTVHTSPSAPPTSAPEVVPASAADITVQLGSVPAGLPARYDLVVANILAEVLVKLFDSAYDNVPLAQPLKPGGHLILAGIIEERADLVAAAAARHGLTIVDRKQEGDWVALVAVK